MLTLRQGYRRTAQHIVCRCDFGWVVGEGANAGDYNRVQTSGSVAGKPQGQLVFGANVANVIEYVNPKNMGEPLPVTIAKGSSTRRFHMILALDQQEPG